MVEDDFDLLEIVVSHLESLGYTVLSAQDGGAALKVVEGNEKIDLLLTDMILAGYRVDAIINLLGVTVYGQHDDAKLLKKPFTRDALARKVREVLDG